MEKTTVDQILEKASKSEPIPLNLQKLSRLPLRLGADPEFIYIDKFGAIVGASGRRIRGVGSDGAGTPAEIRPGPCPDMATMAMRVRRVLQTGHGAESNKEMRWRAAPMLLGVSCGGHVHLGTLREEAVRRNERGDLQVEMTHVGILLDTIISPLLSSVEGESGRYRRAGSYGRAGDYRVETRRRYSVLEWRVPGTWLASPEVTKGLMAGAMGIFRMLHCHKDKIEFPYQLDSLRTIIAATPTKAVLAQHYMNPKVFSLMAAMEKTMTSDEVAAWRNLVSKGLDGQVTDFAPDIRDVWGVLKKPLEILPPTGTTPANLVRLIAEVSLETLPEDYEGFSVISKDEMVRWVARGASYILKTKGLARTPIHLYLLKRERGVPVWISDKLSEVWASRASEFARAVGPVKVVIADADESKGRLALGLTRAYLERDPATLARLAATLSAIAPKVEHNEFTYRGSVRATEARDSIFSSGREVPVDVECDCDRCRARNAQASGGTAQSPAGPPAVTTPGTGRIG